MAQKKQNNATQFCRVTDSHVDCDPGNPTFYQNPYPAYDQMRAAGDFFLWHQYDMRCTASHSWVSALLRDRRFGRVMPEHDKVASAPDHLKPFYAFEHHSMLELEPPEHTRLRKLVNRAFVSRQIENQRQPLTNLCNHLIDRMETDQEIDLISSYAEIIPVHMIAAMIGVPTSDCEQLLHWSHTMVAMYQHNRDKNIEHNAVKATEEFSAYIKHHLNQGDLPHDCLLNLLAVQLRDGDKLSEDELITTVILLLNAGHEATVHAIGNAVKSLLENEVAPSKLFENSEHIPTICEELLRFDPPLHMFTRFALEDVEINGVQFNRGEEIGLLLGAANHDPLEFPASGKLDYTRPNLARQTGFGAGVHFCVGAPLARLEMQIALTTLFQRLPNLKIAGTMKYSDRYHFHGLETLMVTPGQI